MAPRSIKRRGPNSKPEEKKQLLVDMPLDVLIEIFPYLEPLDLLHLSRTTKALRLFLLDRNKSSTLWKSAIRNVGGLPACPDHISPPAYTHLAFVPVCHGCFGPCETVEWELRMRCCSNCWEDMMIPYPPVHRPPYTHLVNVNLPTVLRHAALLDSHNLQITVTMNYFPPVCSPLDLKIAKSRKRPKNVPMVEFVAEQNKFWDPIRKHAHRCQDWHRGILRAKAVQLMHVRDQRIRDIKHMLSELNWTTSEFPDFSQLPEVNRCEPLTPTEWAKIQPRLIRWLEDAKETMIWRGRIDTCKSAILIIQEEVTQDRTVNVKPNTVDIAMLPVVRSILENSVHSEFTLDDAKKRLSRVVPQAIRKWSLDAIEELESFAREQLNLPALSNPSHLPSVIFRCKQCNRRLVFDEALSHPHLYKERWIKRRYMSKVSIHESLLMEYEWLPRDIDVLQADVGVSGKVENLIRRMGNIPSRVTYGEMCRSRVKVACSICRSSTAMGFKAAFDHCLCNHFRKKETEMWTRISARTTIETSNDK